MECWERQLAQPRVTRVSLSLPSLQQWVLVKPLFVPFEWSWERQKGNSLESQEHDFRRKNPFPLLFTVSNSNENTTLLGSGTWKLSL